MVKLSTLADLASTDEPRQIFEAFQNTLKLGEILGKVSGNKVIETSYVMAGKAAGAYMAAAEALAKLLPSSLQVLRVEAEPVAFDEDDPGPGSISKITVTARSAGWKMEEWLAEEAGKAAVGQAAPGVGDLLKPAQNALKEQAPDGHLRDIPPMDFGPTDISEKKWSDVKILGEAVQSVSHLDYAPRLVGEATLSVRSAPIGHQVIETKLALEVRPIRITVTPTDIAVQPGEEVDYEVEVENARDRTVAWEVVPPGHALLTAGAEKLAATLATSEDEARFPIRIRVESTADRSHLLQVKPRIAEARVSPYEIEIEPAVACLQPGDEERFRARVPDVNLGGVVFEGGAGGTDVRWSASAGDVDQDGTLRAPDEPGEVTITAESRLVPDLRGEATVRVGGCTCWMSARVGPPAGRTFHGVASFDPDGGLVPPGAHVSGDVLRITNGLGFGRFPAAGEHFFAIFEAPGLASGGTGTFPIRHAWAEQAAGFTSMVLPDAPRSGGGFVHVTESSEAAVEGRIEARLTVFGLNSRLLDDDEQFHVAVDAAFRAVRGSSVEGAAEPDSDFLRCRMEAAGWGRRE